MTSRTIAYQGIPGSFSHLAAIGYFGDAVECRGTKQFNQIFLLVSEEKADYGIIPVENSLAGSIYQNYDLLNKYELTVSGEYYLKIEHHLLTIPQPRNLSTIDQIKRIKRIVSHPKALEQCSTFFEQHPWIEQVASSDTARAAQQVALTDNYEVAAIASRSASELYNLQIIGNNLEDVPDNYTRFLVVSPKRSIDQIANKCSIIFTVKHEPGSLYTALSILAKNQLNLTKLESRPIPKTPFEYTFYVDFEFNTCTCKSVALILEEFKEHTLDFKVLGYYQAAQRK